MLLLIFKLTLGCFSFGPVVYFAIKSLLLVAVFVFLIYLFIFCFVFLFILSLFYVCVCVFDLDVDLHFLNIECKERKVSR